MENTSLYITLAILAGIILLYLFGVLITHCCVYKKNKIKEDMRDKIVLVTGGTSGIGEILWVDLFLRGATVIYTGRDTKKVRKIMERVQKKVHEGTKENALLKERAQSFQKGKWEENGSFTSEFLYFYKLEMGNLKSVKEFCDWFKAKFNRLDILANNAGLLLKKYKVTEEGFEFTMGVNHYAGYLLVHELLDLLKNTKKSRVITTSSSVHKKLPGFPNPKIDLDDLEWQKSNKKYQGWHRYGTSKLANVLFTKALGRFFEEKKMEIKALSFHPGVVRTGFLRDVGGCLKILFFFQIPFMRTQIEGTQTLMFLANEEYDKLKNGAFYDNCEIGKMNPLGKNEKYWKKFWNLSREEIKNKAGFDLEEFDLFEI